MPENHKSYMSMEQFKQYSPISNCREFSSKLKHKLHKVYTSCVRSCLIYGCETWLMKADQEVKLRQRK